MWLSRSGLDGLGSLTGQLPAGPAVLKDWVKSMKHYWNEVVYIPDLRDPDVVRAIATRFLELRAEDLVGGLVLRAFERYQPSGFRSWWAKGRCVAVTATPTRLNLESQRT